MNRESSICVLNSVHWYDAIFRTHGLSGRIADGMWIRSTDHRRTTRTR